MPRTEQRAREAVAPVPVARSGHAAAVGLNLGCGPRACEGWINCDVRALPGVDMRCDLREGIPLDDDFADYAAAIHLLQDFEFATVVPFLREVRRVLKPGGVLRVAVPDLDLAIAAYRRGDAAYFYVPDEHARSLGAKLVTQVIWYGSVRTPFNLAFLEEQLAAAGFPDVRKRAFRSTGSRYPQLVALDNRERESLFVEAVK